MNEFINKTIFFLILYSVRTFYLPFAYHIKKYRKMQTTECKSIEDVLIPWKKTLQKVGGKFFCIRFLFTLKKRCSTAKIECNRNSSCT